MNNDRCKGEANKRKNFFKKVWRSKKTRLYLKKKLMEGIK